MALARDVPVTDRRTGHQPGGGAVPRAAQIERYAELLWTQTGSSAPWHVQRPAVQESYRQMAATLRATVLTDVMAPPGSGRSRHEVVRLRADMAEEQAHMAGHVERLQEYIRQLEPRVSTDEPRVMRAIAGIQPGDLDPGDDRAGHRDQLASVGPDAAPIANGATQVTRHPRPH